MKLLAPASVIKSIQRGSFSNSSAGLVTVSEVDITKSILNISSSSHVIGDVNVNYGYVASGHIKTSVQLEFRSCNATTSTYNYGTTYWELIEYV